MTTIRCTAAQAAIRYLAAQHVEAASGEVSGEVRYFAGVWAIFGHGNVAGLGEALHAARGSFRPIEQTTNRRWRMLPSPMPSSCGGGEP